MSDWQINLIFQDAKSNKFWRARCVGNALEINYGRIGAKGQNQVKRYNSSDDVAQELTKQANAKRKKGYVDDPDAVTVPAAAAADRAPIAAAETSPPIDLVLPLGERNLELRLSLAGNAVHTLAVENYASSAEAEAAFARLQQALAAEGYQPR